MDVINYPCWKSIYVSKLVKGGPCVSWSTVAMALTMTNTETLKNEEINYLYYFSIEVLYTMQKHIHALSNWLSISGIYISNSVFFVLIESTQLKSKITKVQLTFIAGVIQFHVSR